MRLKKGFTLAEVLIVLMVIGAIATLTIPSLMRGVSESQWKTAYKKAYNTVVNITAMERVSGQLPSAPNAKNVALVFKSLNSNLAVKDYYYESTISNDIPSLSAYDETVPSTFDMETGADVSPWITSEDGISYAVIKGTATSGETSVASCSDKKTINAQTSVSDALKKSCVAIVVDVNGLASGPNAYEPQLTETVTDDQGQATGTSGQLDVDKSMSTLTGDRYYIFVGNDGATAGSKKYTVTGRIAADLK